MFNTRKKTGGVGHRVSSLAFAQMHSALPKTITVCRGVPSQNFEHMQRGLWCCNTRQQRNARSFVRRGRRIQKEVRACAVLISFKFLQRTRLVHAQLQAFRSGQAGPPGGARPDLGRSQTIPRGGRSLAWLYRAVYSTTIFIKLTYSSVMDPSDLYNLPIPKSRSYIF